MICTSWGSDLYTYVTSRRVSLQVRRACKSVKLHYPTVNEKRMNCLCLVSPNSPLLALEVWKLENKSFFLIAEERTNTYLE